MSGPTLTARPGRPATPERLPPTPASTRSGLLCSAAGILLGLACSWWGFYPDWALGHAGRHALAIQAGLTAADMLGLGLIATTLVRARRIE